MRVVTADDADVQDEAVWLLGEYTIDDLQLTPEGDGKRYEIFDGTMVMSPAPTRLHQLATRAIWRLLDRACPPDLEVWFAPLDFRPTPTRSLHFVARHRRGAEYIEVATATHEQRIRLDEPYPVEICPAEIVNG